MATRKLAPRPGILDIEPYVPGKSKVAGGGPVTKLSSNENPFGASPKAIAAFKRAADQLSLYPEGSSAALRETIGDFYGLDPAQIVCGAGSDEILSLLAQAYLGPGDEAIYSRHGFLVYPIVIMASGATPVVAPETELTADVDHILACVTERTRVVYLANPNNPTGTYLAFEELKRLREGLPEDVLLVIDAAYAEYVLKDDYQPGITLVDGGSNTVMTRTFSKIYGLAAARIGWAYCPPEIADVLNRIRGPFNLTGPSVAAGVAALEDREFATKSAEHNRVWREVMAQELEKLGLVVTPSAANFLLVHFPANEGRDAAAADAYLQASGIILRRMEGYGLPHALRLSVGTEHQNRSVLAALKGFLDGAQAKRVKNGAGAA